MIAATSQRGMQIFVFRGTNIHPYPEDQYLYTYVNSLGHWAVAEQKRNTLRHQQIRRVGIFNYPRLWDLAGYFTSAKLFTPPVLLR